MSLFDKAVERDVKRLVPLTPPRPSEGLANKFVRLFTPQAPKRNSPSRQKRLWSGGRRNLSADQDEHVTHPAQGGEAERDVPVASFIGLSGAIPATVGAVPITP